jgi:PAS domain S-box-containing protein
MEPADGQDEIVDSLRLAALPRVAAILDASIPSIVLGPDLRHLRLVNAPAAKVLGVGQARSWMSQPPPVDEPVLKHLSRVAVTMEPGARKNERIRYYRGIKPIVLALTVERLETSDGASWLRVDFPELARPGLAADLAATLALYAEPDAFITVFAGETALAVVGTAAILDEVPAEIEAIAAGPIPAGTEIHTVKTESGDRPVLVVGLGETGVHANGQRRLLYVGPARASVLAPLPLEPRRDAAPESRQPATAVAAVTTRQDVADFVFVPHAKPKRFVWRTDADGRFTSVDTGFAATLGPHASPRPGDTWTDVAARLQLDGAGTISDALTRRTAFHGLSLDWPIEGLAECVGVEWTGMPAQDGGSTGFGVIRAHAPKSDPAARGLALSPVVPVVAAVDHGVPDLPAPEVLAPPPVVDAEIAAHTDHDASTDVTPPEASPTMDITAHLSADNDHQAEAIEEPPILLPATTHISPETLRLSGAERNAFRQIAEALGARFEGDEAQLVPPAIEPDPITLAAAPDTVRVLSTQDLLNELNRSHPPATTDLSSSQQSGTNVERLPMAFDRDARLVDRLPIAVGLTRDEAFIHVNAAFLNLTGYATIEDLNRAGGLDVLFAGPHAAKGWTADRARNHIPLVTRQGRVIPVDARIASVPWGNGNALLMTLLAGDRPAAQSNDDDAAVQSIESAMEAQDRRIGLLEAVVAQASDGVLMLDANGHIQSANAAAEALFGYPPGQLAGRAFVDLIAPSDRRSARDYLDGLARNGIGSLLLDGRELNVETASERRTTLHVVIGRLAEGAYAAYCATLRDISRWKTSQEELTAARRRAEDASAQKSEFLAKISHEIRTPLNAIIGFSEVMLSERFGAIGVDRYKDYLRDIQSSGTHIMSLVNDLLDLSKVEAGKLDLKFAAVHLTDVLAECVQLMQPQANRERIIIRASLTQGLPPVIADLRSIRQIVLNLLSNAIKFTPPGGQVIVSASLEDTSEVVVRVRDTGYGMSPSEVETALEPFRQVANGRGARPGTGTGLGLPLTKALVEANRASLRIDSAVNQGTLVQITFPAPLVLAAE